MSSSLSSVPGVAAIHGNTTFSFVKPDAFDKKDQIVADLNACGITVLLGKETTFTVELAKEFYKEHEGKPFYASLVTYITSGPVYVMVLHVKDAVAKVREVIGATDPKKANPNTIRGKYGQEMSRNAIHGSDSDASAEREISLLFSKDELSKV